MLTLYIANKNYSSWSLRPWLLLRQLGIPFEERLVPFAAGSSRAAFGSFSPTGKVPCLHADGVVVWESLAIVEYLHERYPGVWPADDAARAWARSAAAEMHAGFGVLRDVCSMNCGVRIALHDVSPALQDDLTRLDTLLGEGLHRFGGEYLAGPAFSAVDAFFAPVALRVQTYDLRLSAPVMAWVQRIVALPALREWLTAALAEPWRHAPHEAEITRHGKLVADLRTVPPAD